MLKGGQSRFDNEMEGCQDGRRLRDRSKMKMNGRKIVKTTSTGAADSQRLGGGRNKAILSLHGVRTPSCARYGAKKRSSLPHLAKLVKLPSPCEAALTFASSSHPASQYCSPAPLETVETCRDGR